MNLTTVEIIKALRLEPEFQQAIKENNSKPIEIYQGEGINKKAFTVVIIRMRNKAVSYPNVIDVPFNTEDNIFSSIKVYSEGYMKEWAENNNCSFEIFSHFSKIFGVAYLINNDVDNDNDNEEDIEEEVQEIKTVIKKEAVKKPAAKKKR